MPTARELLEQADALMRRNRAVAVDDIPVLTDSVALPAGAVLEAAEIPAFKDVAAPAPRAPEHVPAPTEAVAATADDSGDSVIQEGEPSDWLHFDRDGPSIIGDAPDSIAIVPQVARPPVPELAAPDAEAMASAELEEIELTTPADAAFDDEFEPADTYARADATPSGAAPAAADAPATPMHVLTEAPFAPWAPTVDVPAPPVDAEAPAMPAPPEEPVAAPADAAAIEFAPERAPDVPATETGGLAEVAAAVAAGPAREEEPAVDEGIAAFGVSAWDETAAPQLPEAVAAATPLQAEDIAATAPVAPQPAFAPPAVAGAADAEKWDAIAEEIRMQVLQRIDLFTDTGLREQLGMRLKPIVDRASADLVATINLHVGELLRAYVAEAIEREIENWRSNH